MAKKRKAERVPKGEAPARSPGRPKASERPITPERLEEIRVLWIRGTPITQIAARFAVDEKDIRHHIDRVVRPSIAAAGDREAVDFLDKWDHIQVVAWELLEKSKSPITRREVHKELTAAGAPLAIVKRIVKRISRTGEPCWLNIIALAIQEQAKICGVYAPTKLKIEEDDFRFAGLTPEECDAAALARLKAKIEEHRQEAKAIRDFQSGNGYGPARAVGGV
jgi:hypothetical protein